ncbi:MAG: TPM domain-containing protein [Rhizobiaceae bacterium]|nr:TPM domain-containing protein [Rhizobiaceae bacterium]MCV0409200.1 TPM domain-containing protein [Rhizobiaceae bacterium]
MAGVLTQTEHDRLAAAVRAAEAATSGEIHVVVTRRSDSYFYPAAFMLTVGFMLTSLVAVPLLQWQWIAPSLGRFVAIQALALGAAIGLVATAPALRIHLVPHALRQRRAHENAQRQFLARNIHRTAERTGVLIFISLDEHHATVIADAGIHGRVSADAWSGMVDRLVAAARQGDLADGLEAAIAEAGALLAAHFPPRPDDRNELDDHVAEI